MTALACPRTSGDEERDADSTVAYLTPPGPAFLAMSVLGGNVADVGMVSVKTVNYEVVHHVNGRVRLRIPLLGHDAKFARRLAESVTALPGVKQVRVSASSCSLVVNYRETPPADPTDARAGRSTPGSVGQVANLTGGPKARAGGSILPELIDCIRVAARADVAKDLAAAGAAAAASGKIDYVKHLGMPAMAMGLSAALVAGLALPEILVGTAVLAATTPHFLRGLQGLREEKRLTVEWLDVSAVVLLTAQASFLAPAVMTGVIEGAEVVRLWTARRHRQAALDLLLPPGRQAQITVERDGQDRQMQSAEVVASDIIWVDAGDLVPADGTVLDGSALVDERQVTGDATPVTVDPGDHVLAATRVVEGQLRILAERTGADTYAASMLALADSVPEPDTRVSNWARKTGSWSVVPTLLVAGAVGGTSGSIGRATGIVAMDMGLGMRVSSPVAILAAQTYAARSGILIRSGRAIEMLAQVDTILFDLDGDAGSVAEALSARLGIYSEQVRPYLLPEQKLELVKELQAAGERVAVVGDGLNDVAAMAQADVSISLAGAGAAAREMAGVLLMTGDLDDLIPAIQIARHALGLIRQNQALVVACSTGTIAYAAFAVLNPIAGVVLNNGVALLGALNSLRSPVRLDRPDKQDRAGMTPANIPESDRTKAYEAL